MVSKCIVCQCKLDDGGRGDMGAFIIRLPGIENSAGRGCVRILGLHQGCAQRLLLGLAGWESHEAIEITERGGDD